MSHLRSAVVRLSNRTMRYAWGSTELIPALRGVAPDGHPQAEVWIGTHPAAPSMALSPDGARPLSEVLAAAGSPERLPFLVKLLAAAEPLSLQVHPSSAQAAAGFAREEAAGIRLESPERCYRDGSHKPEMLVALTPFDLLCGFRDPAAVGADLEALNVRRLDDVVAHLSADDPRVAVRRAWGAVLTRPADERVAAAHEVVAACGAGRGGSAARALVLDLAACYPDDVGVVAALFLNQVRLPPGRALFVPAGVVHSYRRGLGLEVMAASDNVLRAGLTPKHVAVAEVLDVVNFEPSPGMVVPAVPQSPGVHRFRPPAAEFEVWVHDSEAHQGRPVSRATMPLGPRVVLCCAGRTVLRAGAEDVTLVPGEAAFLAPHAGPAEIATSGKAFTVGLPVLCETQVTNGGA